MIAVDTNVWVRYVTNDDPVQAKRAVKLLSAADSVYVPKTVLLELEWVLRAAYELPRAAILNAMSQILGLPVVSVEQSVQVAQALDWYRDGLDFADALHVAGCGTVESFHSFDIDLVRKGKKAGLPVSAV
ncbi:MAG: VapC toxin family PIN domain ribonuclease [Deltaproteobacteria bacterium CG2_30_66_27]|nr:MAG: VapC toxin family PIN domain ribonuclease [Deltaproteobacteria bacterium CG2_30_66_27]PJB33456.1 MAG: VapC toxin family PIN domain ribonuclease [Deltaproteobacteria bacterium CG_4_9_14_3_um_filter_65_9]